MRAPAVSTVKHTILTPTHLALARFSPYRACRIFPKRASILAKKELQWTPFLGQFMTLSGAVFVDRGNNARAVRSLTAAGELLKERNSSLWLFPEGTRSLRPDAYMRPFKKGAFHTAIQAQVPIVPVVCENYWRVYRKGFFAQSATLKVKGELHHVTPQFTSVNRH